MNYATKMLKTKVTIYKAKIRNKNLNCCLFDTKFAAVTVIEKISEKLRFCSKTNLKGILFDLYSV